MKRRVERERERERERKRERQRESEDVDPSRPLLPARRCVLIVSFFRARNTDKTSRIVLRYIALRCIALRCVALRCVALGVSFSALRMTNLFKK